MRDPASALYSVQVFKLSVANIAVWHPRVVEQRSRHPAALLFEAPVVNLASNAMYPELRERFVHDPALQIHGSFHSSCSRTRVLVTLLRLSMVHKHC